MCRLNFIMIKDESAEQLLKQEEYRQLYDDLNGYRAYQKGYCNCGSFVGSLNDRKGMKYGDAITICKKEKLERLYQIKNIMNEPGYENRKAKFLQRSMELADELVTFFNHINEYEIQESYSIQKKYSGESLVNKMGELYKETNDMYTSVETQPQYMKKQEAYANFLRENELLNESLGYFLTKEAEANSYLDSIPLSELIEIEDSSNSQKIDMSSESNVIDEVITRTEKDTFSKNMDEYNSYCKVFSGIIQYVPFFMFCTVWSEPNEIKNVKTVGIDALTIDDLAFLDYDEMICITRAEANLL